MTLHDWVERVIGPAITLVFVVGLGLIAHDTYVYLYSGSVDWITSDRVVNQLAGQVCAVGGGWVALCGLLGRVHAGLLLVTVGPLFITLLGLVILAAHGLSLRLIFGFRKGAPLAEPWQPLR